MGWIKERIDAEYRKHKTLDWSRIAEAKINSEFKEKVEKLKEEIEDKTFWIEDDTGKEMWCVELYKIRNIFKKIFGEFK